MNHRLPDHRSPLVTVNAAPFSREGECLGPARAGPCVPAIPVVASSTEGHDVGRLELLKFASDRGVPPRIREANQAARRMGNAISFVETGDALIRLLKSGDDDADVDAIYPVRLRKRRYCQRAVLPVLVVGEIRQMTSLVTTVRAVA